MLIVFHILLLRIAPGKTAQPKAGTGSVCWCVSARYRFRSSSSRPAVYRDRTKGGGTMKRVFTRSRSLLLAVALAVVAALCTVSTANAASSASQTVVPAAPSNLAAKAVSPTSVKLTWTNHAANQSGVVISRDGVKSVDVQGATASSYTWKGLSPGTKYWFYVASKIYGTPGDPGGYGNRQSSWVGPVYATTPKASAASSTQCNFVSSLRTCKSTDHTVAYYDSPTGDASHCTFVFHITWGDGGGTTKTVADPTPGHHLVAQHTYAASGIYTITVTPRVAAGTCTITNSVHIFTLLNPPPPAPKRAKTWPWAGYGLYPDSGHVTSVTATWRVPKVNCAKGSTARTAVWVGMWGTISNSWLPQIGTDSDCQFGYSAVFQLPSSGPDFLTWLSGLQYWSAHYATVKDFPVRAGDLITASVTYEGKTLIGQRKFKILIKNHSMGKEWSRNIKTPIPASLDQVAQGAGAMVEDNDPGGLAEFNPGSGHHKLNITGLNVTFDTNPAHWTAMPYRIALNGHYLVDPLSNLTSGDDFSVIWKAAK